MHLPPNVEEAVRNRFPGTSILNTTVVQRLWGGFGHILRVKLEAHPNQGDTPVSVIVKYVIPPQDDKHPRGWGGDMSTTRKLRSFRVEAAFYQGIIDGAFDPVAAGVRTAAPYAVSAASPKFIFLMEDLDGSGFGRRATKPDDQDIRACLRWLARFHAHHLTDTDSLQNSEKQSEERLAGNKTFSRALVAGGHVLASGHATG